MSERSRRELYRDLYEYEKDCNEKMLGMLESVPEANRGEARFQQAVTLADHLGACRIKWLDFMEGKGTNPVGWWNREAELAALRPLYSALEERWAEYLARLEQEQLVADFTLYESGGETFDLPVEVQIVQLIAHAPYHRGQIALLVDQLGGETVDTDYADWWWAKETA